VAKGSLGLAVAKHIPVVADHFVSYACDLHRMQDFQHCPSAVLGGAPGSSVPS
jgi:hypothetical protein